MAPEIMQLQKYDAKVMVISHTRQDSSCLSALCLKLLPSNLTLIRRQIFGVLVLFYFSSLLGKLHSLETIKYKLNELLTFLFVSNCLLGFLNYSNFRLAIDHLS